MKFKRECLNLINAIDPKEKREHLSNIVLSNLNGKLKVCAGTSHALVFFDVELEGKETPDLLDNIIIPLSVWKWVYNTIGVAQEFHIKSFQRGFRASILREHLDFNITIAPINYAMALEFKRRGVVPADMVYSGHLFKMLLKVFGEKVAFHIIFPGGEENATLVKVLGLAEPYKEIAQVVMMPYNIKPKERDNG